MAYVTQSDVENYTGFGSLSFKSAEVTMNATQWASFCSSCISRAEQAIHRFCNVTTFATHTATEYHNGRPMNGDWGISYLESDLVYNLREVPATTLPTVMENTALEYDIPSWATRTQQSTATGGDFSFYTRGGVGFVRFHNNIPKSGINNVSVSYLAGYPEGSQEYEEIKQIELRLISNLLVAKRKLQESITIRNTGVDKYSQMWEPVDERKFFTDDIKEDLKKYQRVILEVTPAWD